MKIICVIPARYASTRLPERHLWQAYDLQSF